MGSVAKHTVIYGVGVGLNRLAGFLMLPIYTRFLTPADYGVLELLSTTVEVIGMIAGVGLVSGIFKFHAEQDNPGDKREIVSTAGIAIVVMASIAGIAGFLGADVLNGLVFPDGESIPLYFQLFFVTYVFRQAELTPLLLLRIQQRSVLFVSMSLLKLVLMLALNIYFVVFRELGILGVLTGNVIATGVSAAVLNALLIRSVGLGFSIPKFKKMVIFGYPLIFWFLGSFVFVFSDRYFLNHFTSTAAVGTYALAYRFVSVLSAIGYRPFQMVWDPKRYEIAKRDDPAPIFRQAFTYMNLGFSVLVLGLGLLTREVILVMAGNPHFHEAYKVVPILVAAQVLYHWSAYANLGLYMNDRTPVLAWVAGIGAAIVIGLNLLLIPAFGAMGAACATLIAYALRFVAIYTLSQREVALSYDWGAIRRLWLICGAVIGVKLYLQPESVVSGIALGTGFGIAAVIAIWLTVLRREERQGVAGAVQAGLRRVRRAG
jgi:O-antigen/teichoic acid export membrane protein